MYRDVDRALLEIVEPILAAYGMELVDIELGGESGPRSASEVRIVVDTPEGDGRVLVDVCARAAREIGHAFDAEDYFERSYTLEVCSPGVDRVLGRSRDFERAIGREVELVTREPIQQRKRFRGRLVAFDGELAQLSPRDGADAETWRIPFVAVARAKAFHPEPIFPAQRARPSRRAAASR